MKNKIEEIKKEFKEELQKWIGFPDGETEPFSEQGFDELWSFIQKSINQAVKEEDERIMDLSYEAMSGNDWTDKNHSKVCSFLNSLTHTDLKGEK